MIEMVARSGPPEAMNCPAFVCDACRRQVTGPGNMYWTVNRRGGHRSSSPMFVGHKGACGRAVEQLMGRLYPDSDGWCRPLWDELSSFLRHLTFNAEHPFAEDADGNYHDHRLIQPAGTAMPTLPGVPDTRIER